MTAYRQDQKRKLGLCKTLAKLWPYARPRRVQILLSGLFLVAALVLGLVPPWLIRYMIDDLLPDGNTNLLGWAALGLVGIALLEGACDFIARYLSEYVGQSVVFRLRNTLYHHLNRLSFSFYDHARTGDLMSRVTEDSGTLNHFFGFAASRIISNTGTVLGIALILLLWNWRLGLAFLAMTPALIHAVFNYSFRVHPLFSQVHRQLASLNATLEENLQGIYTVKLFGREDTEAAKFGRENQHYLETNLKALQVSALWMPYIHFLTALATALALWLGGKELAVGRVTPGTLVAFLTYAQMLTRPIRQTGMLVGAAARAGAAGSRLLEVLEMEPEIQDKPGAYPLPPVKGQVVYQGVGFSYDGANWILDNIDLKAEPGQLVALVGPSGAGKTTLINLLPRFYQPTRGRITIDGHDLGQVTLASLREQVGIVLQDSFLFNASIGENIAYGRPEASRAEIQAAAKSAQIHDFITSLPLGYETPVGSRGVTLSGGQRQRLAIARVLLTDPRLLILDEATSELDPHTEGALRKALAAVIRGRTTFIIAHRLWTIEQADQILVIDGGRITERGTHRELLQQGGHYAQAYATGLGNWKGDCP